MKTFGKNSLALNVSEETERIVNGLRRNVHRVLHRQGVVVGVSGGIDSSTVLALCVRAFGPDRVVAILLPEKESSPESVTLGQKVAHHFGVQFIIEDITAALEGAGCYRRRDQAIRQVFPEFSDGWKSKIILPGNLLEQETLNVFSLAAINPEGKEFVARLPLHAYSQIVAASNFKQRTRMAMLYYHAELRNYAVAGTANKDEHDQGFFVKYGDGGVDVAPIVHLFKIQVYQLAQYLGVPEEIQKRTPTSDTYSGGSTQEEFFFRVPFELLDTVWFGYEQGASSSQIAQAVNLQVEQVERIISDLRRKKRTTMYLRMPVLSMEASPS